MEFLIHSRYVSLANRHEIFVWQLQISFRRFLVLLQLLSHLSPRNAIVPQKRPYNPSMLVFKQLLAIQQWHCQRPHREPHATPTLRVAPQGPFFSLSLKTPSYQAQGSQGNAPSRYMAKSTLQGGTTGRILREWEVAPKTIEAVSIPGLPVLAARPQLLDVRPLLPPLHLPECTTAGVPSWR